MILLRPVSLTDDKLVIRKTPQRAPKWAEKVPRKQIWRLLGSLWSENFVKMGAKRV